MQIRIILAVILVFVADIPFALGQTADCSAFHHGIFHVYFAINGAHHIITRDDQTQKDVRDGSTDTMVWHINWLNDSDFTAQRMPDSTGFSKEQEKFYKKHKLYYHLQPAGKDYCIYTETVDLPSGALVEKDTMWLHEVAHPKFAPLAVNIRSESLLRDMHFSDTSSYAVVYIYRPKTGTFPGASYDLYAEDHLICVMNNNSSYIYAVYRKGPLTLRTQLDGAKCSISLNIEAGKSYYVRSTMPFGFFGPRNFGLVLKQIPAAKGQKEFDRTFR